LAAPWADFTSRRYAAAGSEPAATSSSAQPAPAQGRIAELFSSFRESAGKAVSQIPFAFGRTKEEDPDPWFGEQATRLDQLEAALTQVLQSSAGLARRWRELSPVEATTAMNLRVLGRVMAATDESSAIACSEVSNAAEQHVKLEEELANQIEHSVHDNVKDYVRELDAIREVLAHRTEIVRRYTIASRDAQAKKAKGSAADLAEAERQRDLAFADLEAFSKAARADIQRTYDMRRREFQRVLNGMAVVHRDFSAQATEAWKVAAKPVAGGAAPVLAVCPAPAAAAEPPAIEMKDSPANADAATAQAPPTESQPATASPYSIDD
jgi:hypothetical protein